MADLKADRLLDVAEPGRDVDRKRARALAHHMLCKHIIGEAEDYEKRVVRAVADAGSDGWRPNPRISGEEHCARRMALRGVLVLERRGRAEHPAYFLTTFLGDFIAQELRGSR